MVQINESWIILGFNALFVKLHVGRVAVHRIKLCLLRRWFRGTQAILTRFNAGAYRRARLAAHQAGQARRETIVIGKHLEPDVNNNPRYPMPILLPLLYLSDALDTRYCYMNSQQIWSNR